MHTILVANRGEIARRVFATARQNGFGTVAVFSDPDADSPHVPEADVAVRLPGKSPTDTYLRADLVVAAATAAGADAVHPGYGFLSENAEFAQAVQNAGLTWIGPPTKSIELMGSKVESKKIMRDAGVPVLEQKDPADISQSDLPVLIKASAGGGGRGMRVVREIDQLADEIEAAQREALSAFGDATVFCEKYLETGRHIEVQVMADRYGTVWAVGERECSIQRRHQKVIEEAPSPLVEKTPGMRERLFEASRLAANAIGYEGAGTVEFLSDENGDFFFLEMNTRLQVEHPVTECTTGLDLVDLQFRVADGERLPAEPPPARGHSIEVRLYAEDPAQNWQPQSGPIHRFHIPGVREEFAVLGAPGIRLDSGIVDGGVVGVDYDPMLAKVISFADTRTRAAHLLAKALHDAEIHGLKTNRDLLVTVLRHPAFLAGDTDTAFFATHDVLTHLIADEGAQRLSALAAALSDAAHNRATTGALRNVGAAWRNMASAPQRKEYESQSGTIAVNYLRTRGGITAPDFPDVTVVSATPDAVELDIDGLRRTFRVARYGRSVFVDSALGPVALDAVPRFVDPSEQVAAGSLVAPMPGSVVRVGANVGDTVAVGTPIVWLEAMKMEHTIVAPAAGVLTHLGVTVGQQVDVGSVLAVIEGEAQ
ncbi:biotin carboxylase N-terminal domain-containing protein [Actinomycetes bacterium M1A6_2h]